MLLSTFKSGLKFALFAAVVLWLGQVVIGGDTVGAHFQRLTKSGWHVGKTRVEQTKLFAGLTGPDLLHHWFHNIYPPSGKVESGAKSNKKVTEKIRGEDPDEITASDRESLLRLLR
jgi:hypothetical protein